MLNIVATTTNPDLFVDEIGFVNQSFCALSIDDAKQQMIDSGYYDPDDFTFTIIGDYVPVSNKWRQD